MSKLSKKMIQSIGIGIVFFQVNVSWSPAQTVLTPHEINADLDQFQTELEERFAYLKTNNAQYKTAISTIREETKNGIELNAFGIVLIKVLGLFQDCHASIGGIQHPEAYLPFILESIGDRYIAFLPDRTNFIHEDFPYITKIDNLSIDDWCGIVESFVARGSPQLVKVRSLRFLSYIQFARSVAGFEEKNTLQIELTTSNRRQTKTITMNISHHNSMNDVWPQTQPRIIQNNIGYLRITNWLRNVLDDIETWMPRFRNTRGLIIDVRDNSGGTRNILRTLYPYLCKPSDPPIVANAAKYRLHREHPQGYLDSRHMFPQDWEGWPDEERKAISTFMTSFTPEWTVPEDEFSPWHFWVLTKRSNPEVYTYSSPVVFLINQKGFSATGVIVSALKGLDNITLIGTPTGGGSGAMRVTTLKHSRLRLGLSSMASFQKDGKLFDGNGVQPDIYMEPVPEYFLKNGPDNVLEKAIQIILAGHQIRRMP